MDFLYEADAPADKRFERSMLPKESDANMINPFQIVLNTKFRNKLIFMCITAIVPVTLTGIFLLYNLADTFKVNASNEMISTADSLRTRLSDVLVTISNVSERVMQSDSVVKLINNRFENEDEYREYYSKNQVVPDFLSAYPQLESVSFYVEKSGFVAGKSFRCADEDIRETYWYREAAKDNSPKWQVIQGDDDEYHLCRVCPLKTSGGKFCGVMLASVNSAAYKEIALSAVGYRTVFCAGQGSVFYSDLNSLPAGAVVNSNGYEFRTGTSGSDKFEGDSRMNKSGYTVVSYFDHRNTGSLFQVYIIKPDSVFGAETNSVILMYVWYIFLCILLSVLIAILFSSVFSRRIQFLKDRMHSVAAGNFELSDDIRGTDEIFDLYQDLKRMVLSMQNLINDAYKSKIQSETFKLNQVEAEFKALASQINPHFLYNTLETIRMKAYCNNDKETADLVKKLGKFMRRCLEVKDGMVTLESELEFTKSYLELQAARFGDRVSYSMYSEVDKEYKVLPLIIQPIVENAFVHGIEGEKANGRIDIKILYRGENVVVEVTDNGQGIPPERLEELIEKLKKNDTSSGKSIGLTNVNKRIKMYHGEQYGMEVETAVGEGTTIRLTLPRTVDENVMKRLPLKYAEISGNISNSLPVTAGRRSTDFKKQDF